MQTRVNSWLVNNVLRASPWPFSDFPVAIRDLRPFSISLESTLHFLSLKQLSDALGQ